MTSALPLRTRLTLLFATGFGGLLLAAAALLYVWLGANYRRDFDRELRDTARSAELLFAQDLAEYTSVRATVLHITSELVFGDRAILAADTAGTLLAGRRMTGQPSLEGLDLRRAFPSPTTVILPGGRVQVLTVELPEGHRLVIGHSHEILEERLRALRLGVLTGIPLILLLGSLVGMATARSVLRPIVDVAEAAESAGRALEAGALAVAPIPDAGGRDEIGTLTRAFNTLAARLGDALHRERGAADRQRQFLAEVAHELRTPVAIVRSEADAALSAGGPVEPTLARITAEADRMGRLVGDLLVLAREEAGGGAAPHRCFLDDLAQSVLARARRLPAAAGRVVRLGEPFEEAAVMGDPALLERALLVLVENALLHAPGSPIELTAGREAAAGGDLAWAAVRDWGPGVPAAERARIFQRFARAADGGTPGAGLGLAIATHVAEAHGGTVRLESPPDGGARFRLELPAAP